MPVTPWPSTPPPEPSFVLVHPGGETTYVAAAKLGLIVPQPGPSPAPVTPAPAPSPPKLAVVVKPVDGSILEVAWTPIGTDDVYGRDGTDAGGAGPWKSEPGQRSPQRLTNLRPGADYVVTVTSAGKTATVTAKTAAPSTPAPVTPAPTTPAQPPIAKPAGSSRFKAFTLGASVSDAANGNFNRWLGKKHGLYVTWGDNGKIWAIDTPASEYGANSIATLGDYDLAIAPQRKNTSGWAGAAKGDMDATWRADLVTLKAKWGSRKGTCYYNPWHELNGYWFAGYSVVKGQEVQFRAASQRFRKIWNEVIGTDARFVLGLVFNRNAAAKEPAKPVRAQDLIADGVWDALGVDWYDFGMTASQASPAAWAAEVNRVELGDSPVGLLQWVNLAKAKGLPLLVQEWGVQFGDNDVFVAETLKVFSEHGYRGGADVAGKILGAAWHNLQGASPDPNAGKDFFITSGGKDYPRRPKASKALREWSAKTVWRVAA